MDDLLARDSQHLHDNHWWSRVSLFLIAAEGQSDLLWWLKPPSLHTESPTGVFSVAVRDL